MIDLKQLQKDIYKNKLNKGFNVTDINKEFCLTYGEMAEAYEAWRKKQTDVGEEIADVVIYLLGLSEILNVDLENEILKKVNKKASISRSLKILVGRLTRFERARDGATIRCVNQLHHNRHVCLTLK